MTAGSIFLKFEDPMRIASNFEDEDKKIKEFSKPSGWLQPVTLTFLWKSTRTSKCVAHNWLIRNVSSVSSVESRLQVELSSL